MLNARINRRNFVLGSASALALGSLPRFTYGQTTTRIRLEWQQFKVSSQYSSYLNAVRTMKANTTSTSRNSWQYWINVHRNYCPHDTAYFLAWHRGYMYYFERQLQIVSGDPNLALPYWDYYTNPNIPSEFTDPASGNPLYVARSGTNVYNALDLSPFASTVWNFQRGTTNAFEPKLESAPHNPVHNLIGNFMANVMTSPTDPIFYLHHCNIDRLWHAWALPDGKGIPPTANPYSSTNSSPYWAGTFTYASDLTMPRYLAYYPGWLNYDYANDNKPSSLPPVSGASSIKLVQAQMSTMLNRPATATFAPSAARTISSTRRSLGGVRNVSLGDNSLSVQLPIASTALRQISSAASAGVSAATAGAAATAAAGGTRSVIVVADGLALRPLGANGGYFYNLYLNLPASGDATSVKQRYFLGTLGAFEATTAAHHGTNAVEYPATEVLANMTDAQLSEVTVSLVRVNGSSAPRGGPVIGIGELRLEISTEAAFDSSQLVPKTSENCYCDR
ncbi:tyrosinase family protein [Noviherbaspirillum pedocola]|uniref:Tyrosinase family protein n=1 Tax=Noviherbaspirillum pedocola TaxID=2801341 RepID=A0A934SYR6_9BURK|nr:tyrosinase family protein [Noviherbaspirillum pedocola]MBK4738139.1 tyrosinase family protein [Noviherbaspirillum pedocola]